MAYTQFDEELQRKLAGIFPQSSNVVDVTDVARTFPRANVSGFPQRLSPADVLTLMSYTSDPQAEGRANAFRSLVGRGGAYRRSAPTGLQASLNSIAGTTDDEIQAAALKTLREAINSGELPLGNMAAFNHWAVTLPHHFIKDVRSAYQSMSDQVTQEGTSRRAEELQPGKVTRQGQDIAAAKHDVLLEAGEIESQQLGLAKERADLAAGKIRKYFRGNEEITEVLKDGRWVFHSSAPRWDAEATTKQQDFGFYIEQVNEARKKEGLLPLTDREEADIFNKYFLKEQIETSQAWTPPMIKEFSDKKTAFSDTTGMIKRMLVQLANPEVVIGTVASLFKGIEAIGSQFRQLARSFGEDALIDPKQYDFGKAEYSGQLQANITGLAYTLAKAVEGGKLSESDVQLRIKMITGGGMSKDTMTANLMEIYNNSVRGIENAYLSAREAGLPGSKVYTVGEFLDTRKAGTLLIEPEIKGGKQTGIMALGYYASDGKFHPITHWYDESQVQ